MVIVKINDKEFYMDGYLKSNLDIYKKDVLEEDSDCIILIDGGEGAGKSCLGQQVASYLDPTFNINDICFEGEDFKKKTITAKPHKCILFDESLSALNKMKSIDSLTVSVIDLLAEIRQKNLFIIIILPSMFDLAKPIACWRTKFLLHVYKYGDKMMRGFYAAYNYDKKMLLYTAGRKYYNYSAVTPNFRSRFCNGYTVDEKQYRQLKLDNLHAYSGNKKAKESRSEKTNKFKLYTLIKHILERKIMNMDDVAISLDWNTSTVDSFISKCRSEFDGVDESREALNALRTENVIAAMEKDDFLSGIKRVGFNKKKAKQFYEKIGQI